MFTPPLATAKGLDSVGFGKEVPEGQSHRETAAGNFPGKQSLMSLMWNNLTGERQLLALDLFCWFGTGTSIPGEKNIEAKEGRHASQRDLARLEDWGHVNLMRFFNQAKCRYPYRLRDERSPPLNPSTSSVTAWDKCTNTGTPSLKFSSLSSCNYFHLSCLSIKMWYNRSDDAQGLWGFSCFLFTSL